ncbi:MAG: GtrA family protein [Acidimicrobiales bacterium]
MRSRLRFFAIVGLFATAVDFFVFRALAADALIRADILALTSAAIFAYLGNRFLTFRGTPGARWVRQPGLFALTAGLAGTIDVATVVVGNALGANLTVLKLIAIGLAAFVRWTAYRLILFKEVRREMGERRQRPPVDAPHRLSVVVPAYNEGERIAHTVESLRRVLTPVVGEGQLEILVVDDGSTDNTIELAEAAAATVVAQPQKRRRVPPSVRASSPPPVARWSLLTPILPTHPRPSWKYWPNWRTGGTSLLVPGAIKTRPPSLRPAGSASSVAGWSTG